MASHAKPRSSGAVFLPCIMGPTGAGKTAASLALAEAFPVSIINADSRQVYRDFPIITAQPSPEEQQTCPHLLYGFLPTEQKLGAGAFSRSAEEAVFGERAKKRLPVLVGGTGLYFKALLTGLAPIPPVPPHINAYWQNRCDGEGSAALHVLLHQRDPDYAAKIHPNDRQRITRALEVLEATGKTFSWWHAREMPDRPYFPCKIGIGLTLLGLEGILERRIELMLSMGALEEARKALEICPHAGAPGWTGIGCSEVYQYLTGKLTINECKALWLKNTRAYAKRQLTWFRADPDIRWFEPWQVNEIVEYVGRCRDKGEC